MLFLALGLAVASPALAADPVQQHNSNAVWFENWIGLTNGQLRVTAPDGQVTTIESSSGTPVFQLSGAEVLDGVYQYELSAATSELVKIANPIDNGRGDAQRDSRPKPFYTTGRFTVARGVIVTPEDITEGDDG